MVRVIAGCAAAAFAAALALSQPPARMVAITFDDLPGASPTHTDAAFFERVNRQLLESLTAHGVPAIGFVNESKIAFPGTSEPRAALLKLWIDAGLELGNHTYSHGDLHTVPLEAFKRDTLRGEIVTRGLMRDAGKTLRFFRHPFLHTGRDAATRSGFEAFLAEHGYRVAPVTIDNYDYMFARAYDRAALAGNDAERARIISTYIDYMTRVVTYYEAQSRAIVGREIPQVLLVHVSALNAETFDALAGMFKARGYQFIPLERALQDSAYHSRDEYYGPGGITWLHRWALTAGKRGTFFAGEPEVPAWIAEAGK